MTDKEKVIKLLKNEKHMVIAVMLLDGTPWAIPVRVKAYSGTTLEWDSRLDTLHSEAIERSSLVSVTIFEKGEGAEIGVYIKGYTRRIRSITPKLYRYSVEFNEVWLNDESHVKRRVKL